MGNHLALLLIGLISGAVQSWLIPIAGVVGLLFDYRSKKDGIDEDFERAFIGCEGINPNNRLKYPNYASAMETVFQLRSQ
jgi:hypothetical protein